MSPSCSPTAAGPAALTHALQQVPVVVEALLAIALVAGLRIHALALLADLCSEQYALVDVCGVTSVGASSGLYLRGHRPCEPRTSERGFPKKPSQLSGRG